MQTELSYKRQPYYRIALLGILCLNLCFAASETPLIPSINQTASMDETPSKDSPFNVNFSLQKDSLLGPVGQVTLSHAINETHAVALELDGGTRILRLNGTYGFALNDKNRLKLTAEYLAEDLDFTFYTGDTRQWVDQGAVGASYQYLLGNDIVKSVEISSHYSHAPSKNLSDKTIPYADGSTLTDYRRIAGGDDWNGTAETSLGLWPKSLVSAGGDYDQVRYDTQYCTQTGHDAQGFGGHVRLQQLLTDKTQLNAESTLSQLYTIYSAGLNWVLTSSKNTSLSTGLNSSYTKDRTTERSFWMNGINLSVIWDGPHKKSAQTSSYTSPEIAAENLSTWVQTPAVRMPDVLAIADECVKSFRTISGVCPSNLNVTYNSSTHTYSAPNGWYQYYPTPQNTPTEANWLAFDSANMTGTPSGIISCQYGIDKNELILRNSAFQNAVGTGTNWVNNSVSSYWPLSPDPNSRCSAITRDCPFQTVAP